MSHEPSVNAEDALELANAHLAAIVQSSDDAIVSKDLNGVVQSWNAGAERMFGYSAAEVVGKSITILFPEDRLEEEGVILARLRSGERVDHFETVRRTKDGRLIDVSVSISPIRDASGQIVGASKVARDITERKRAEAERAKAASDREELLASEHAARKEAERHGRLKDEFLATLSHELRTPLSAVLGWTHVLRRGAVPGSELDEGLAVIERNARVQASLIDDLLDMSRIISGKLRLNIQPIELSSVVAAALESIRPAAEAKGVRLTQAIDVPLGWVSGDSARLQQIFWNLLSNAVKFTPRGGRVHVVLERVDSHVEVSVTDSGEGIAPEFLAVVFERFRQADASTTRRHGGLGLGLAIVRHLAELHGGTVRASSPGRGQGATFIVSLPLRAEALTRRQPSDISERDPHPSVPSIPLPGVRVLAVDDEADSRTFLERLLGEAGAEVHTAAGASEALEKLKHFRPDVLITDIGMPGMDGYTLLRQIRAIPRAQGGSVPAVALTAFARPEDRRRALLAGFQMHVAKPVEPAELLAVVASLSRRVEGVEGA